MLRRLRVVVLVGLVFVLMFSIAVPAQALTVRQKGHRAVTVGENQLGKRYKYGTDGPNTFSCSGLMRYILRTVRVDRNAPWTPERYLKRYRHVSRANLRPGDIVIYRDWATMYVGSGKLLNSNAQKGRVVETRMAYAGKPLSIVRPYR